MRALSPARVITVKVIELQKSLLDTWKFFRPFLNTLTANDKYSLNSKEKWMEKLQMHLSQKENIFSEFFSPFLESALNFEHFRKKDDPHSLCISEITDHERRPCCFVVFVVIFIYSRCLQIYIFKIII